MINRVRAVAVEQPESPAVRTRSCCARATTCNSNTNLRSLNRAVPVAAIVIFCIVKISPLWRPKRVSGGGDQTARVSWPQQCAVSRVSVALRDGLLDTRPLCALYSHSYPVRSYDIDIIWVRRTSNLLTAFAMYLFFLVSYQVVL